MGHMKTLYGMLQEAEQAMAENDPHSLDYARRIIGGAQAIAWQAMNRRLNTTPREDQTQMAV